MIPFWKDTVTPSLSIVVDGVLYTEEWKDIEGYEGLYQVSSFGRVKSLERMMFNSYYGGYYLIKERLMTHNAKSGHGYPTVGLHLKGKQKTLKTHRLVGFAHVPNPDSLPWINHIDGDKLNPFFLNLEWTTIKENTEHGWKTGLAKKDRFKTGKGHKLSKRVNQLTLEGQLVKTWDSLADARRAGFSGSEICLVANGKASHHKGFLWKYIPH